MTTHHPTVQTLLKLGKYRTKFEEWHGQHSLHISTLNWKHLMDTSRNCILKLIWQKHALISFMSFQEFGRLWLRPQRGALKKQDWKTVADRQRHAAYHNKQYSDKLFIGVNINCLEWPWISKIKVLVFFFAICGCGVDFKSEFRHNG